MGEGIVMKYNALVKKAGQYPLENSGLNLFEPFRSHNSVLHMTVDEHMNNHFDYNVFKL
jgi:hypothetical protein